MANDIGEKFNLASEKAEIVVELKRYMTSIPHPDTPPDDRIAVKSTAATTNAANTGLGFNILAKRTDGTASRVQHTGASGTLALIDFDRDLIVIVLTQVDQRKIKGWRGKLLESILASCK